jgi:hypothetical protein
MTGAVILLAIIIVYLGILLLTLIFNSRQAELVEVVHLRQLFLKTTSTGSVNAHYHERILFQWNRIFLNNLRGFGNFVGLFTQ